MIKKKKFHKCIKEKEYPVEYEFEECYSCKKWIDLKNRKKIILHHYIRGRVCLLCYLCIACYNKEILRI